MPPPAEATTDHIKPWLRPVKNKEMIVNILRYNQDWNLVAEIEYGTILY
jgi:hypothetical protein